MTDLDQLDALHAAATPGEWYQLLVSDFLNEEPEDIDIRGLHGALVATALVDAGLAQYRANASYIVGAHNAWPAISKELRELRVERDQLIADNDRLRRALEWQREALDCGYYQYPDGHWSCQECSRPAPTQKEINHTDECAFGQIEAALSAPPPDAVKRYEARVIEEYIDQNSTACDACQHVMIDVTSAKAGVRGHCIAGDPEGEGSGCAHCMQEDLPRNEALVKAEVLRGVLRSAKEPWAVAHPDRLVSMLENMLEAASKEADRESA